MKFEYDTIKIYFFEKGIILLSRQQRLLEKWPGVFIITTKRFKFEKTLVSGILRGTIDWISMQFRLKFKAKIRENSGLKVLQLRNFMMNGSDKYA